MGAAGDEEKNEFLLKYLYSGKKEVLEKAGEFIELDKWNAWNYAILIEANRSFFDTAKDGLAEEIQNEVRRVFFYVNLNARQSLRLFQDVYCDYALVAKHIYLLLRRKYEVRFYLAVSCKFEGYECLPEILGQLEQQMEEKFYHPENHIFINEEEEYRTADKEVQDSQLMDKISEDISRKDTKQLWKHFHCLADKFQGNTHFSAMYVKFVFSNVLQELFLDNTFFEDRCLEQEIDRLYSCNDIRGILKVTEENIRKYEAFLERSMDESREEVGEVKNYISQHYADDLNMEMLAKNVHLPSGYLSFIFKKETGMSLNRYIHVIRMEKAKELLGTSDMTAEQVSLLVGFASAPYFCRIFKEFYGISPESCRKGTGEDEGISAEN